jgi:hypothetical protein
MMSAMAKQPVSLSGRDEHSPNGDAGGGAAAGGTRQSRALQREVARYIGQMSAELSTMARKSDFDLLAYFLEMARVEARALVRKFEQGNTRPR